MPGNDSADTLRDRGDVLPVLRSLVDGQVDLVSYLAGGETVFRSKLVHVDPAGGFILVDAGADATASAALLAQGRCIFHAGGDTAPDGTRIEFVCTGPADAAHAGRPAVRLNFPEVLARWQRAHTRTNVSGVPLQCVADSEGIMPFEGLIVDIGPEGLGFLVHEPNITLEPGTLLRSCLVELPGKPAAEGPCKVDLEVCYSQPVTLGDGTTSLRSGCRFLDSGGAAKRLIDYYMNAS
jgi:c-di-GMP-binding flagellar brake protein YcgR